MVQFWMMCGLPGSGKSSHAKEIAEEHDATIFASDELREELFNDVNHQEDQDVLFKELHKRIKECLRSGKNAVYDACNISYKHRMAFLQELKNIDCWKTCVLMAVPYEECLKRNAERERKVPEHVIKRMYMNFNIPGTYEGFDEIQIVNEFRSEHYNVDELVNSLRDYDQGNSHHKLSLGDHLWAAYDYYFERFADEEKDNAVSMAIALHDIGKPFCRTNTNARGIDDGNAHYFNHNFCSAYDSLFVNHLQNDLDVAIRIMWHMQPYFWKEQKTIDKYRKLWGEELYRDIMTIHWADVAAH